MNNIEKSEYYSDLDNIQENIRLIIWDMDETFWKGTLTEGNINIPESNINLIKLLTRRGIVNSISSKNDYESVKSVLLEKGLWDYFIFPQISWERTKAQQVAYIIDKVKLRPQTILFLDDNHMNLEEVKYYIPGINIAGPEVIPSIVKDCHFTGKDDSRLLRLKQYKVLERKAIDQEKINSNEEFLTQSNICVDIITTDLDREIDRIYELNQRTNQLNYTKNRCSLEEIKNIIALPSYSCGYVKVNDKYGDYGIVGFFALNDGGGAVEHFYFSCRILGLGVEQYVYSYLGYPNIKVVGEVAVELRDDIICPWINVEHSSENSRIAKGPMRNINVLLCGGCDLEQSAFYLKQSTLTFDTMFNYVVNGRFETHPEELEILCQSFDMDEEHKSKLIKELPFYDENTFQGIKKRYDVIVYSPLIDYSIGFYHSKNGKDKVVYGNSDFPDLEGYSYLTKSERNRFRKEYDFEGPITETHFRELLHKFRAYLDPNTVLIVLTGSEINIKHPEEPNRYLFHKKLNKIVEDFCSEFNNVIMLDVRKYLSGPENHTDNIRHYTRNVYYDISKEILDIINDQFNVDNKINVKKELNISFRVKLKEMLRRIGLLDIAYKFKRIMGHQ